MKRVIAFCIIISMSIGLLSACSNSSSKTAVTDKPENTAPDASTTAAPQNKDEKVTLKVVCDTGMAGQLKAAEEILQKTYPNVSVEYITSSWGSGGSDLRYKELILIASGETPDIAEFVWGKEFFNKGIIEDLTDEVKGWEVYGNLTSGQLERMSYQGKIYGITGSNNCPLLFYNKDILDKIGANVPKTLDELEVIAKQIKEEDLKSESGKPIYTINFEGGNWFTDYWLWANGGTQMNEDFTKTLIDSPESIAAYQYMQDMIKNGYAPKYDGTGTQLFLNGQLAFVMDGTWDIDACKNANLNFGITVMPTGSSGKNTVSAGGQELGIFKASKNKEIAIEFLRAYASKEYFVDYVEKYFTGTTDITAYSDPKVQAVYEAKGWTEGYAAQQEQLKNTTYNFLEAPFVFQDANKIYSDALQRVLVNLENPATVMKDAAEKINQGIADALK